MPNIRKIFTGPTYILLSRFTVISDVYRSSAPNKTTCIALSYSVDFKAPREPWNPLSKAVHVPGKLRGPGGHSKRNCLQDRGNCHRSQITNLTIVYSTVYSDADQRKQQSSASMAFVRGIHRGPVNSPHKWPVTRKMFPFDGVIMYKLYKQCPSIWSLIY